MVKDITGANIVDISSENCLYQDNIPEMNELNVDLNNGINFSDSVFNPARLTTKHKYFKSSQINIFPF